MKIILHNIFISNILNQYFPELFVNKQSLSSHSLAQISGYIEYLIFNKSSSSSSHYSYSLFTFGWSSLCSTILLLIALLFTFHFSLCSWIVLFFNHVNILPPTFHNCSDSNQQILKSVIIINMQSSDTPVEH